MGRLKTAGLVAAFSVVAVAVAQGILTAWPPTTGAQVVAEWYSDVPWHQKLGTYAGNQIDEPIMLPYEGLGADEKKLCKDRDMSDEDCMIELGVVNILGMFRTDSPYTNLDAPECKRGLDCIQVTLDLHSFWTRAVGNEIKFLSRDMGSEPQHGYRGVEYGGYVLTDGSVYAPQMPWYMSHYCDGGFPKGALDMQDPVCYADYFSPMNSGFNPMNIDLLPAWPRRVSFSPQFTAPPPTSTNHCSKDDDKSQQLTKCTIALAGFDLTELSPTIEGLQYSKYNDNLVGWFNRALTNFADPKFRLSNQHKFPWAGTQGTGAATQVTWKDDIHKRANLNPFLGQFVPRDTEPAKPAHSPPCDVGPNGANYPDCIQTVQQRAFQYVYPRQCRLDDLNGGAPDAATVAKLRQCGLNYEIHHNGFMEQWPRELWDTAIAANLQANQYGRTSFLFAGVPGMQLPASFYKDPASDSGLTDFEKVHNASIFSLFLPMANVADEDKANVFDVRYYQDKEWFHVLLMSNHMEANPEHFLDGIRGKVLWHNEYRTDAQFTNPNLQPINPARWFAAAFRTTDAKTPYHNNTCDGCHVRNGSGIPINTKNRLDPLMKEFMATDRDYTPYFVKDYTFTGQIRPMKLVFFDLKRETARADASRYSEPLSFSAEQIREAGRTMSNDSFYYGSMVMNFYGDSFHVTTPGYGYDWTYADAPRMQLVVDVARTNAELGKTYVPQWVVLSNFRVGACSLMPKPDTSKPWPTNCAEVDAKAVEDAIKTNGEVGYMLLNGKRLGNLSAIEAIPSSAITGFRASQVAALGTLGEKIAGEIIWNAGARDGIDRPESKIFRMCRTKSKEDCFIGRFGWLGDRVSLEDQVANAAFVEMNMTTTEGYRKLYLKDVAFPIRYLEPNCGPANRTCKEAKANRDLSERDIDRMADYARWVGNPTRSEFKVTLPDVVAGEKIFKQVKCDTCHVIQKIKIIPEETMLTANYRERLKKHISDRNEPFLSYIGTDLLMHDMGYLSQVGIANESIRDPDGVVLPKYENYVQKVRTPALKALRFNRFVTESHRNTKSWWKEPPPPVRDGSDPACDFLLHDGRACDAIEAAFLHDGPAVKKLGMIQALNGLSPQQVMQLRAFLYSL